MERSTTAMPHRDDLHQYNVQSEGQDFHIEPKSSPISPLVAKWLAFATRYESEVSYEDKI